MSNLAEKLDDLIARVKRLPKERQAAALDMLQDVVDEPYELSTDELAVLEPALAEALRGEGLSDAATDDILNKPWR